MSTCRHGVKVESEGVGREEEEEEEEKRGESPTPRRHRSKLNPILLQQRRVCLISYECIRLKKSF